MVIDAVGLSAILLLNLYAPEEEFLLMIQLHLDVRPYAQSQKVEFAGIESMLGRLWLFHLPQEGIRNALHLP